MPTKHADKTSCITAEDIERLMQIAGRMFARHGLDGVGIRTIAKESGIKMPTIFYHFGSKAALYDEVLDYKYRSTIDMIVEAIERLNDPMEKLDYIVGAFFDLLVNDKTFLLLVHRDIIDVISDKNRESAFFDEYSSVFDLFARLLQAALHRSVEKRVVFALVSLILGYCELVVMVGEIEMEDCEKNQWYATQRVDLLEAGKRICLG